MDVVRRSPRTAEFGLSRKQQSHQKSATAAGLSARHRGALGAVELRHCDGSVFSIPGRHGQPSRGGRYC